MCIYVFIHQYSSFENGAIFKREPMNTSQDRCHMHKLSTVGNDPGKNILNALQLLEILS